MGIDVDSILKKHTGVIPENIEGKFSKDRGLSGGIVLDLMSRDVESEEPWDFSSWENRNKIREYIRTSKPIFIIGSPVQAVMRNTSMKEFEEMGVKRDTVSRCEEHQKFGNVQPADDRGETLRA